MEVAYDMVLADGKDQIEDSDADKYKELEELFCATCGDVHTSIRNQLVECSDCHLLYHQECHRPPISDQEAQVIYCFLCDRLSDCLTNSTPLPLL